MPEGSGLMVSMATGSGKSLLFQLYAHFWCSYIPGACVVVITPTVALALDHVRTLSTIPGLERSCALTGDVKGAEREEAARLFQTRRNSCSFYVARIRAWCGARSNRGGERARAEIFRAQRPIEGALH